MTTPALCLAQGSSWCPYHASWVWRRFQTLRVVSRQRRKHSECLLHRTLLGARRCEHTGPGKGARCYLILRYLQSRECLEAWGKMLMCEWRSVWMIYGGRPKHTAGDRWGKKIRRLGICGRTTITSNFAPSSSPSCPLRSMQTALISSGVKPWLPMRILNWSIIGWLMSTATMDFV